ncbi:hypothetical protein [Sporosarcina obsidiansis]|uniref:hypothetical protein n=1 Tax=Sporosarcina obsidiansis TaxID=2660748 RepID=UPI00129B8743|nr:hypothetical protein [Sporosarcina obsidiansis]
MKRRFPLPLFFASAAYTVPKQIVVRVTLLFALAYMVVQMAIVNIAIYSISTLPIYLFYHLAFSIILVYLLTVYFSISVIFSYREYGLMASLPIKPQRIVSAKVISSLLFPLILTGILQIPTVILLGWGRSWVHLLKWVLLLPTLLVFTVLLLLFLLSLLHLLRKHLSTMTSLLLNSITALGIAMVFILWIVMSSKLQIATLWAGFSMSTLMTLIESVATLMERIYEAVGQVPVLKPIIAVYTSADLSLHFLLIFLLFWAGNFLLFKGTVHNLAVNYLQNGAMEMGSTTFRKSKGYAGDNVWGRYMQREKWIIQSDPYFKLQILLSSIMTPILSVGLLLAYENQWMPMNLLEDGRLEFMYAYFVLFMSCMNNTSGTPYSREGKYYPSLQSLPFDQRKVYLFKVWLSSAIGAMAIISSFVILMFFGHFTIHSFLLAVVVLLLMFSYNLLASLYDRKHPLTEWKNPSEAIKSNPNVIFSLLFGLPLLLVVSGFHFYLYSTAMPLSMTTTIVLVVIAVCDVLILKKVVFVGR